MESWSWVSALLVSVVFCIVVSPSAELYVALFGLQPFTIRP